MDFKDVMTRRRSVNFFDPEKNVSDALLKEVIETAAKTPSGFNLQPWSLIVLRNKEEKMKLQQLAWNQPKISEAPVTLIVLADREGWKAGHPFAERNFRETVKAGAMTEEQHQWFADTCTLRQQRGTENGFCLQKHRIFCHVPDAGCKKPRSGHTPHGRI